MSSFLEKIKRLFHKKKNIVQGNPFFRNRILEFEEKLSRVPGAKMGDEIAPLKHTFLDGCYMRQITMPKGMLVTSKIHKVKHPYFIMKGDVSVLTEEGTVRLKAPYSGITEPGTKRVLYIHEECIWITCHVTKHKDLKKIERQIIAASYDDLPKWVNKRIEEVKCIT